MRIIQNQHLIAKSFWKSIHLENFESFGKFDWTCLLPVPANVLLGHGRVKQKVCVFKEGWDGRGASALELFVIVPWNHLNPYQSPLVQRDSRCSVDIRSGKEWDILMLWRLSTYLAKSGKVGSKPLPGLTWRITLAISVGSPDGSCCCITNIKIKFKTEQGRRCSHWRIGRRELQGFPSHLGVPPATSNETYLLKEWCVDATFSALKSEYWVAKPQ